MGKNNGSNNMPGWVKRDLQVLKRVSVSLIETVRETRHEMAETRREMVGLHQENRRRIADNETRITQNEKILAEVRNEVSDVRQQTASIKRTSDIHTKAILELLKKI